MNKQQVLDLFDNAFRLAQDESSYGTDALAEAQKEAFDAAAKHGWDWESDQQFVDWCLKATDTEIISEGKKRFIKAIEKGKEHDKHTKNTKGHTATSV